MGGAEYTPDSGGASVFTALTDTFASYAGKGGYYIKVKSTVDGLEAVSVSLDPFAMDADWVNVKADYGAVGDGVTNDTTAIQNAINSGKNVYFPIGIYKITSSLSFFCKNQRISGAVDIGHNSVYTYATVIKLSADGIWGFQLNDASQYLTNIGIIQDTTVTPTSGGGVKVGSATVYSHWHVIENVTTFGTYIGFHLTGLIAGSTYKRCMALRSKTYNFHIDCASPYGFGQMLDCVSYHSSADGAGTVGIMVSGTDTSRISGGYISGSETPLYLKANSAIIYQLTIDSLLIENKYNATSYAIRVGDSTYTVNDCKLTNLHVLPVLANYGLIYLGANSSQTILSNTDVRNGGIIDIGTRNQINSCNIDTGTTGLQLNGNGTVATGNSVYGCSYGLNIVGGTNYTIVGNNFAGNTTPSTIASSTKASSIIKNNQGVTEYETSVASTPDFIGQEALVAGIWYKAIATSSSADWKALN